MKVILGIDPGSLRTGYGVLQISNSTKKSINALDFGTIHLPTKGTFADRLVVLERELSAIIQRWSPNEAAIENIFLGKNADSAFKLGHARGVCLMLAGRHNLKIHEYATRHIKKALTGSGSAEKEQVLFMVEKELGIKTKELDASDALALALCRAHELEQDIRLGQLKELNS